MKSILLQAILMFLIMGTAISQVENFEDEIHGDSSFTLNGFNFTTTGDLIVEVIPGYGCNFSDGSLSTGTENGGSSGTFGSIKVTNPGDKFTVSTSAPWCAFVSVSDGFFSTSGDIKFIGTLATGGTIEETFFVTPLDMSGYGEVTFSSGIWEDQELTELEATMVSSLNYLALDNIAFENIVITSVSNIQAEEIKIYPNPAVDEIEIMGIDDSEVKIIDALGRIVKEQYLSNQKMDIAGLPGGIYFISIYSHNQQITKRIVKQ